MKSVRWAVLSAIALAWLLLAPARGAVMYQRIADTATPVPGGSGSFTNFTVDISSPTGAVPAVDGMNVAFLGNASRGVYRSVGGTLSVVADTSTAMPNTAGGYGYFRSPSISGTNVAFYGGNFAADYRVGIYSSVGGAITRIADSSLTTPNGGTFDGFSRTGIEGTLVSFYGDTPGPVEGVYRGASYAALTVIADTFTPIPGGVGNFHSLNSNVAGTAAISGSNLAFYGSSQSPVQRGIYKFIQGSGLFKVADRNTPIPGGGGNFLGFDNVHIAMDRTDVAFVASDPSGVLGVYAEVGGVLRRIIQAGQPRPGGGTFFTYAATPPLAFDQGTIAINDQSTIYLSDVNGTLRRLIGVGDTLDGRTIAEVDFGPSGLSGGNLAFWADFTNNTSGIYLATGIPEPAAMGVVAALIGVRLLGRRRSQ